MTKIFIADLHLGTEHPEMVDLFMQFLHEWTNKAEALYILGDFFEVWVGDDDLTPLHLKIITALKNAAERGLKIYFLHGNRDFLLGKRFFKMTQSQLLPDATVIDVFGTPTLLMHGDTLCTADIKYLRFRKKARNWFFQKLFLLKSLEKRRAIAQNYRAASKKHIATLADHIMDVTPEEVQRVMQQHQVQHLIHGHTHRQAIHPFKLNNQPATRTVLGAWHERGNALLVTGAGQYQWLVIE